MQAAFVMAGTCTNCKFDGENPPRYTILKLKKKCLEFSTIMLVFAVILGWLVDHYSPNQYQRH